MYTWLKQFMKSYLGIYLSAAIIALIVFGFGILFFSPIKDFFISVAGGILGGVVAAIIIESTKSSVPRKKKKQKTKTKPAQ